MKPHPLFPNALIAPEKVYKIVEEFIKYEQNNYLSQQKIAKNIGVSIQVIGRYFAKLRELGKK